MKKQINDELLIKDYLKVVGLLINYINWSEGLNLQVVNIEKEKPKKKWSKAQYKRLADIIRKA